ncbi:prolipoprotein diacylglyceryl transferase [Fulvivirgaceae bacterium BMA10]|uniref:Phosphatidylglycerol--prolipoprotein diacylglyceryl transferase n=1 Tax=Splendidivirga corallicola TaxID=3051826 RepID=A0ABT8KPE7_9BACT|nr:prolipoprotein diacylglyceryl transferase [Fulvivirgaceae bacterium BMA10]
MLSLIDFIIWHPSPEVVSGWNIPRWYGVLFAAGFLISQQLLFYIFKKEGKPPKDVETLTVYIVIATIIGARLGHVLFYDPVQYFKNPLEILMIWHGGLASHGATIGILTAIYLYAKKKKDQSFLWVVDRIVIAVAITGCLIRFGNFMNSEILGKPTSSNFGVVFARELEESLLKHEAIDEVDIHKGETRVATDAGKVPISVDIKFRRTNYSEQEIKALVESDIKQILINESSRDEPKIFEKAGEPINYELKQRNGRYTANVQSLGIPRHAAQLYESIYCILLFIFLFLLWNKRKEKTPEGLIFGLFLVILFGLRFVDEFFKENQEAFEDDIPLNMGQWLSIPLVIIGIYVLTRTFNKKQVQGNQKS